MDPLAIVVHAVSISGFSASSDALIMGAGPVGNLIGQVLKAYGSGSFFCTDITDCSLSIAEDVSIDHVIDIRKTDFAGSVKEKTSGRGVDLIFDTIGDVESQEKAIDLLVPGGTFVNLVTNTNRINFSLVRLSGERSIKTSSNNLYGDVLTAIKLVSSGKVQTMPLITHRIGLDDVNEGFRLLKDGNVSGAFKVIILP